jgi:hypothetical protein
VQNTLKSVWTRLDADFGKSQAFLRVYGPIFGSFARPVAERVSAENGENARVFSMGGKIRW